MSIPARASGGREAIDPAVQAGLTALLELAVKLCEGQAALAWANDASGPRLVASVGLDDAALSERLALATAQGAAQAPDELGVAPIHASDGAALGGLCVFGPATPRRALLPDLAGQAATLLAIDRRLSAHLRTEQAARASEAHLRYVIDRLPVVVYMLDRDGLFTMSEGGGLAALGLKPGQVVGTPAFELYAPFPVILENMRAVLSTGEPRGWFVEIGDATYESRAVALRDEHGAIVGLLGMATDISERVAMERANKRLQEEVIAAQASALAELSTPLIPISSDTVVLPLIGTIDAARVDRVLHTLLEGITASRARVAIVDLTGVTGIDPTAAAQLGRVAAAVRLLGASVVWTGLGPATAQTLIGLDVDLRGVVLRGTLESGIAWALGRG